MFNNIGGKIKTLAVVVCVIGMIGSAILAFELWSEGGSFAGLLALAVGCLASWIGSFFTYGFGKLIEETERNREINQQIFQRLGRCVQLLRDVPVAFANDGKNDAAPARPAPAGSWTCRRCGGRNLSTDSRCKECGVFK